MIYFRYLNQTFVALEILFLFHTGAFFHLIIFFNITPTPTFTVVDGLHFSNFLALEISAFDLSGSPGRFGIKVLFLLIKSAIKLT